MLKCLAGMNKYQYPQAGFLTQINWFVKTVALCKKELIRNSHHINLPPFNW
jgi:hypothetical protein